MKTIRTAKFFPPVEIGDYVRLPVPTQDRGPSDGRNMLCRIVDYNPATLLYELSSKAGVLEKKYARNAFDKCDAADIGVTMNHEKQRA